MEEFNENEDKKLELPGDHTLFNLAYWSKKISWVIVVLGILTEIFYFAGPETSPILFGGDHDPAWVSCTILSSISGLLPYAFDFIVLQAVGEVLYLVIDIKEQLLNQEK